MKTCGALELTGAISALAGAISCHLSADEVALLASILVQLGDTLATIAARDALCGERNNKEK